MISKILNLQQIGRPPRKAMICRGDQHSKQTTVQLRRADLPAMLKKDLKRVIYGAADTMCFKRSKKALVLIPFGFCFRSTV